MAKGIARGDKQERKLLDEHNRKHSGEKYVANQLVHVNGPLDRSELVALSCRQNVIHFG